MAVAHAYIFSVHCVLVPVLQYKHISKYKWAKGQNGITTLCKIDIVVS